MERVEKQDIYTRIAGQDFHELAGILLKILLKIDGIDRQFVGGTA